MTLKVRLAAMMVLILVAVLSLQFLLMERDRRRLLVQLDELSAGMNQTTAEVVQHARTVASGGPAEIGALVAQLEESRLPSRSPSEFAIFVWADSSETGTFDGRPFDLLHPDRLAFQSSDSGSDSDSDSVRFEAHTIRILEGGHPPSGVEDVESIALGETPGRVRRIETFEFSPGDSLPGFPDWLADSLGSGSARWEHVTVRAEFTGDRAETLAGRVFPTPILGRIRGEMAKGDSAGLWLVQDHPTFRNRDWTTDDVDIVINLPLSRATGDSFYSVQVRYPMDQITEELAASRRRALLWMSGILGAGILGAVAVAGQFTRPIQTLQDSFRRVVRGDLDLEVVPKREDEIGQLTHSFNDMVSQLKESKEVEHRLADAERLAAVGRLAAGVAHEVRNPLNAILLTMQQLDSKAGKEQPDPADIQRYSRLVTGEIQRLERMVTAFLDLSKSGTVELAEVDLTESLSTAVTLFAPEAEAKGITLTMTERKSHRLEADPRRLPMVWNNLLANAIEAAPEGGNVWIEMSEDAEYVAVAIEDDGAGFAPDVLPRVWDPFYSGGETGTGLGLSIVRSVVERHGGTVEARNGTRGGLLQVLFPREPIESGSAGV